MILYMYFGKEISYGIQSLRDILTINVPTEIHYESCRTFACY